MTFPTKVNDFLISLIRLRNVTIVSKDTYRLRRAVFKSPQRDHTLCIILHFVFSSNCRLHSSFCVLTPRSCLTLCNCLCGVSVLIDFTISPVDGRLGCFHLSLLQTFLCVCVRTGVRN